MCGCAYVILIRAASFEAPSSFGTVTSGMRAEAPAKWFKLFCDLSGMVPRPTFDSALFPMRISKQRSPHGQADLVAASMVALAAASFAASAHECMIISLLSYIEGSGI